MLKSVNHYWTRDEVEKDKTHLYIFGENIQDAIPDSKGKYFIPTSTQAVCRGLDNTIGIPTKKTRGIGRDAYFHDTESDFALFCKGVDAVIEKAKQDKRPIKISAYGLGTGAAAAHGAFVNGTGRFFDYLYKRLGELDKIGRR
jgi:hypothetical protein